MKNLRFLVWFIFNIILIELGFISFVLITLLTLENGFNESRNNFLIIVGFVLLISGSISMYFFSRGERIKKSTK